MKKFAFLGLALLWGSLWVMGGPLTLCDYKAPKTSLTSLTLAGAYRYFDDPATPEVDVNAGRLGLNLGRFYDRGDYGYTTSALGELGFSGLSLSHLAGQAATTHRFYFQPEGDFFGFVGAETSLATGQPQLGLRVNAGAGYGRFSDVTPLAKAFRIQRMLLERKAIAAALPEDTLLAIAQEIGRRIEYAEVKDLVAAVVQLIETAARTKLDARTVLMIEDEILAEGKDRYCGWAIQAGMGYEVMDPYGGPRDMLITASADWAWAPQMDSQLRLQASLAGPFDIANEHLAVATLTYEGVMGAGILVWTQAVAQWEKRTGEEGRWAASATVQLSFALGLANVGVSLTVSKPFDRADWSRDISISFTMKLL